MIISVKVVKRGRSVQECSCCRCTLGAIRVRFYGAAENGDRPHVIYECVDCFMLINCEKLKKSEKVKVVKAGATLDPPLFTLVKI